MTQEFLDTAYRIGRQIADQAIWYGDRCNWTGSLPQEGVSGRVTLTEVALGPDLYGGTSGIAFFLAQLYAATGDEDIRRVTLGAIRQALSRADVSTETQISRLGLYGGRIGIALAVASVGAALSHWALLERATDLLAAADPAGAGAAEFDLVSGRAGTIIGLLALHELLHEEGLVEQAIRAADHLLEGVKPGAAWYSWTSPSFPKSRPLTGFSHGTAGAGYALCELSAVTGMASYGQAAQRAFDYERHLFDAEAENWPDLRGDRSRLQRSFATFWCHGAPGIALSRLRAHELSQDRMCRSEAITAIGTTHRAVTAAIASHRGNYSLCHGLAGNAEVLLHAARMLGGDRSQDRALALRIAELGREAYARSGSWPCGVTDGQTPNLFLGLAGTGLFYLRIHDPAVPSVLLPVPGAFAAAHRETEAPARADRSP